MNAIPRTAEAPLLPWAPELTGEAAAEASPPPTPPRGPGLFDALWLPLRLAWRQLRAERSRLASAIAGVLFACVLVFMQLGFRSALFESATALLSAMRADIFLMHPMTTVSFKPETLPRVRVSQAMALPEVQAAVPVYLAQATWRNPENGSRRAVQLVGFDTESGVMEFPGLAPLIETLKRPDTLAFDRRSRPEFGDVARLLAERGPFPVQVGNRLMEVAGLVEIGPSFGADGNVVMSELNFRRIMKDRQASAVDLVAIKLRPGADRAAAVERLRAVLPPDVLVLNGSELVAHERDYWENATPIGFIFMFGSIMGLIVGMVIVYQILFSDIASHLKEYATLKAMGYSNGFLGRAVLSAALILAVLGFLPGFALSAVLYDVVGKGTFLPLAMDTERALGVFAMIFTMCGLAGLLAMRKLRDANPADMF
ncbi:FtsX-like permease family protein [Belnapia sp. T6]|uniref:FtsX-like permease family protein n=1 Tax=Belnapia mucosa TaxID=2804532 RepID=A0ABS1V1F3_9PROT|nr:ABC transporter permease DevC [Belnapia mucosa]MBL6454926.1 FtsX-like permease family protein [Belnapia mucosa]